MLSQIDLIKFKIEEFYWATPAEIQNAYYLVDLGYIKWGSIIVIGGTGFKILAWSYTAIFIYLSPLLFYYLPALILKEIKATIGENSYNWHVSIITGLFYETENEPGSPVDYTLLTCQVLVSAVTILGFGKLLYRNPEVGTSTVVWNFVIWSILVVSLPSFTLVLFGSYLLNYVKGEGHSNHQTTNVLFDSANLFGFLKRFLIQLIRYALITIKLYILLAYLSNISEYQYRLAELSGKYNWTSSWVENISILISWIISEVLHVLFEVVNVFIIYYAQLGAFVIILYWLLNGLVSNAWPIVKFLWLDSSKPQTTQNQMPTEAETDESLTEESTDCEEFDIFRDLSLSEEDEIESSI